MYGQVTGEQLREHGIKKVTSNNVEWIESIRECAKALSLLNGSVSANDLRAFADGMHFWPKHQNAYGPVFRAPGWETIGYTKSNVPSRRAGVIRVWRWSEPR